MILYLTIGVFLYAASNAIDPDPSFGLKPSIAIVLLWPIFLALIVYYALSD